MRGTTLRSAAWVALGAGAMLVATGISGRVTQPEEAGQPADMERWLAPMCREMASQRDRLQLRLREMDDRLESLVEELSQTKGSARVDVLCELTEDLVMQRRLYRERTIQMQETLMLHMSRHVDEHLYMDVTEDQRPRVLRDCDMFKVIDDDWMVPRGRVRPMGEDRPGRRPGG